RRLTHGSGVQIARLIAGDAEGFGVDVAGDLDMLKKGCETSDGVVEVGVTIAEVAAERDGEPGQSPAPPPPLPRLSGPAELPEARVATSRPPSGPAVRLVGAPLPRPDARGDRSGQPGPARRSAFAPGFRRE